MSHLYKVITLLLIMVSMTISRVYAGDTSNLSAAWLMNETSGNRVDSSTNGNNLTANGSTSFGTGQFGNAVDLESTTSDYLSISDASQTGLDMNGTNYTILLWYKPESVGITAVLIAKTTSFNSNGYTIHIDSLNRIQVYIQSTQAQTTAKITSAGTWYHLAFVFDDTANTVDFYLDGTLDTSMTGLSGTISDTTGAFEIGREPGGSYADGLIDDVAVFKRKLSSTEITDIKNNGLSSFLGGGRRRVTSTIIS